MGSNSSIEWTEATWNPVTGCDKISPGCKFCYADRLAKRLQKMGNPKYANGFDLTIQESALELPLRWKKPQTIFVNSMSDLFHEDIEEDYVQRVFDVMKRAYWHRFQVLTKRSERMADMSPSIDWPKNVWMGVSVEHQDYTFRIDHLRSTGAHIKFLSLEPLLGPLSALDLTGIHWAIVGGESGPGSRPILEEWVLEIREECQRSGVPFFFKQWGGTNKKKSGRLLQGRTWDDMPKVPRRVPGVEPEYSALPLLYEW
jgi:protein gp37